MKRESKIEESGNVSWIRNTRVWREGKQTRGSDEIQYWRVLNVSTR